MGTEFWDSVGFPLLLAIALVGIAFLAGWHCRGDKVSEQDRKKQQEHHNEVLARLRETHSKEKAALLAQQHELQEQFNHRAAQLEGKLGVKEKECREKHYIFVPGHAFQPISKAE